MKELVSVIVPVYKVENYLTACIESILNQTYKNIEVILVDDGSPDQCPAMCDEYHKKDSRVRVIHKSNGGLSDARNAGVNIASGEYIIFVDSDDVIDTHMIETLLDLAKKHDAQIVATTKKGNNTREIFVGTGEQIYKVVLKTTWEAWGKLIQYDLAKKLEFPTGYLYEDLGYVPYAFLNAKKAVLIDNGMYYYTEREDSIMGNEKKNKFISEDLVNLIRNVMLYAKKYSKETYEVTFVSFINLLDAKYRNAVKDEESRKVNQKFIQSYGIFSRQYRKNILFSKKLGVRTKMRSLRASFIRNKNQEL